MEQEFTMEPTTAQQFQQIAKTLEKTKHNEGLRAKIAEKMMAGIREFTIPGDTPHVFGKDRLEIDVIIGTVKEDPTRTVLKGLDARLTKEIKIPAVVLQDASGHVLLNVPQLDERLGNPVNVKSLSPGLHEEMGAIKKKYSEEINRDMQLLMQSAPDIFNLMQAKHNVQLPFTVAPELLSKQAQLIAETHVQNTFSSYFNLTPIEIYGMLKNGNAVNKNLFTTKKYPNAEGKMERKQFNAWIKLNLKERNSDGSYKIDFINTKKGAFITDALNKYNFTELNNDLGRSNIIFHLRKGSLLEVTNGNPVGEKKLLIAANPGYEMRLNLYRQDGTPIFNHNDYLKVGLKKEVSEVVTLATVDYRRGSRPAAQQDTTPLQPIVININSGQPAETEQVNNTSTKRHTGNRVVSEGGKSQKKIV